MSGGALKLEAQIRVSSLNDLAKAQVVRINKIMQGGPAPPVLLLALPDTVLREIFSWCTDVQALLRTCRAWRTLSRDPAAAALLLTRCPSAWRPRILTAFAEADGAAAVAQQVLQLLHAGPDSGGPHSAGPALLMSLLCQTSAAGDAPTIKALLARPQPPDVNCWLGRPLYMAVTHGPHLAAIGALLKGGANPCISPGVLRHAAGAPKLLAVLPLLLQHCPAAQAAWAIDTAWLSAVTFGNAAGVTMLLPAARSAGLDLVQALHLAARRGVFEVLRLLCDSMQGHMHEAQLNEGLLCAVRGGHCECAALLLDLGADVNHASHGGDTPLLAVARPWQVKTQAAVVRLLLQRGAVVSEAVQPRLREMGISWG